MIASGLAALALPAKAQAIGSKTSNDWVRFELQKYGDDGAKPRQVTHFFYLFAKDQVANLRVLSANELAQYLEGLGLVRAAMQIENGLAAEHETAVAPASFDVLTTLLADEMPKLSWDYDGWDCVVVHPVV